MPSGRTLHAPSPFLGVWLLGPRNEVSTSGDVGRGSQVPWGGHGQGWQLAQGSHLQLGLLPWPQPNYSSHCPAAECLTMGAAEPGPDAGQHPSLVLTHPQGGLRSASSAWTGQVIRALSWPWWPFPDLSSSLSWGMLDGVWLVRLLISDTWVALVNFI